MQESSELRRFTVTALLSSMPVGAAFLRKDWPAHVTLASNFVTAALTEEVVIAVRRAGVPAVPTFVHFGGEAWFGPSHDILVRLVLPGPVSTFHQCLADELDQLPGFTADEPGLWRVGYRPHLTLGPEISLEAGEVKELAQIAIAQLSREKATIVAIFDLPTRDTD